MDLYLHEAITLISLDDEKGNFTHAGGYINYAFGAAFMIDLLLEERIKIEDGRVHLLTNAITDSRALNNLIERIAKRKKPDRISNWIHICVQRLGKLRQLTVDKLVQEGVLEKTEGKVLWVFSVDRYPTKDAAPENELRQRLKALMLDEATEPDKKERMLLVIILKCELYAEMIKDKAQRKAAKARIEQLTDGEKMQEEVGKAVQEMLTAVMITTTVATM
ncbi:MAG: GOLPH3/VPS74 family protein [Phaeodactylibacter xiamenensis]|jgi:hypothetical protein|uniref:Golgi phosphoprotein 3 (GPP34) n=1 Tax=Phaeodactylibacter xiamenensis TaxID=1524460 RepID=A0A098S3S9_9BACT|nr:GPP34 family phosphoprotein [Phaeodactylibacter xiamenensis]KGE86701.1 hypothetical protein IX84_19670 [Phaeodactylibacter xiamenensis]MCR9055163.1 GPP34 family phosphoprotein [bacterium]